jgi:hypothetical protein
MAGMSGKEIYLGDGLYASFDGWQVRLRAPREGGDHEVYLDGNMLLSLIREAQEWGIILKKPASSQTGGEP